MKSDQTYSFIGLAKSTADGGPQPFCGILFYFNQKDTRDSFQQPKRHMPLILGVVKHRGSFAACRGKVEGSCGSRIQLSLWYLNPEVYQSEFDSKYPGANFDLLWIPGAIGGSSLYTGILWLSESENRRIKLECSAVASTFPESMSDADGLIPRNEFNVFVNARVELNSKPNDRLPTEQEWYDTCQKIWREQVGSLVSA